MTGQKLIANKLLQCCTSVIPNVTIQQAFDLAVQHHQAGHLAQAEALYREVLAAEPRHADALHLLGVTAHQAGKNDVAVELITQAIALVPAAHYFANLGEAHRAAGESDQAVAALRHAVVLKPDLPEVHYRLGNILFALERLDEAIPSYLQAIAHMPDYADAYSNLGNALFRRGRMEEAVAAYCRAVALAPASAHFYLSNLSEAHRAAGELDQAIAACRQAIAANPDYPEAWNNLGLALLDRRNVDGAIAAFRQAIALDPNFPEAHNNLGVALLETGNLDEATSACGRAIALRPDYAEAHSNLGNASKDMGQLDEAITCYRRALAINPDFADAHSNLIYSLHFHPCEDSASIFRQHREWNRRFAEPLRKFVLPHGNDRDPGRRLRIGYVSPDFRDHVIGRNVLPILERHDHERFEIFCYASVKRPDELTPRFREAADEWRDIAAISDHAAADLIRADRIDILIDLSLHMTGRRLLVFAHQPAPVQITWAGYPGTTGLDAIHYRLTDPHLDPPGLFDAAYSEESFRLPDSFWCYDPLTGSPPVNPLPALTACHVTFGSLNNYCKVHEGVIELWSKILCSVKNSRLLLLSKEGDHRRRALDAFHRCGVAPGRIEWFTPAPRPEYLAAYHRIDLGLDTFPYNGHTTSLDSFWMGVPVITLVGKTVVGRGGLSQAMNLGMPELVAHTPEDYVQRAVGFASDLPRLAELRRTLRERMQASRLMDAPRFTRNLEESFRAMWRKWCV